MTYADIDYYNDTYKGSPELLDTPQAEEDESNRLLERGSDWIDRQTRDRIVNMADDNIDRIEGLGKLSAKQQENVKKANCAWVEATLQNGEVDVSNLDGTGFSLGDYSQSPNGGNTASQRAIYQRAFYFLDRTGLTYKGTWR